MIRWVLACVVVASSLAFTADASADRRPATPPLPPPIAARLLPWHQDGEAIGDARYFYVLEVGAATDPNVDVVVDRRLLHLEMRDETHHRTIRCDHPNAPNARVAMRQTTKLTDNGANTTYREWVDLRSYCFGSALAFLDRGAHVHATYGFVRGGRTTWVARSGDNHPSIVDAGEFDVAAKTETTPVAAPVAVRLATIDRASAAGMSFAVSVATTHGRRRVYIRHDLFRFRIRGPLGVVECGVPQQTIVPIADFFTPITERSAARRTLEAQQFCPDAFEVEGVYEVTPSVDLPYSPRSTRPATDVVTGHFDGPTTLVRIRSGSRGYVDQDPGDHRPRAVHGQMEAR